MYREAIYLAQQAWIYCNILDPIGRLGSEFWYDLWLLQSLLHSVFSISQQLFLWQIYGILKYITNISGLAALARYRLAAVFWKCSRHYHQKSHNCFFSPFLTFWWLCVRSKRFLSAFMAHKGKKASIGIECLFLVGRRWQGSNALHCLRSFQSEKFQEEIQKHRKNCECCPMSLLIVR